MNIEALFLWLVETTVATTAAACLGLVLRQPLRRACGAGVAYACWALVPAALLATSLPRPVNDWQLLQVLPLHPGVLVGTVAPFEGAGFSVYGAGWVAWLLAAWVAGALTLGVTLIARQRRFAAALGALRYRPDGTWESSAGQGPAVVGVWRPRIVVPPDFDGRYTERQAALILEHERIHLRRGDVRASLATALLRCLYWFNPLLHVAAARFRLDQELACDAAVMARHPGARRNYGEAMLNTQLSVPELPVGCHWQSSQSLKERILMLATPQPTIIRRRLGSTMLCALLVLASYVAWASRPVVAAAPSPVVPAPLAVSSLFAGGPAAAPDGPRLGHPERAGAAAVSTPPPRYPADAAAAHQSGRVVLKLLIAVDGSVKDLVVEESAPAGVFDAATVAAARQWRFSPQMRDGEPVEGWVRVPVSFEAPAESPDLGS